MPFNPTKGSFFLEGIKLESTCCAGRGWMTVDQQIHLYVVCRMLWQCELKLFMLCVCVCCFFCPSCRCFGAMSRVLAWPMGSQGWLWGKHRSLKAQPSIRMTIKKKFLANPLKKCDVRVRAASHGCNCQEGVGSPALCELSPAWFRTSTHVPDFFACVTRWCHCCLVESSSCSSSSWLLHLVCNEACDARRCGGQWGKDDHAVFVPLS